MTTLDVFCCRSNNAPEVKGFIGDLSALTHKENLFIVFPIKNKLLSSIHEYMRPAQSLSVKDLREFLFNACDGCCINLLHSVRAHPCLDHSHSGEEKGVRTGK